MLKPTVNQIAYNCLMGQWEKLKKIRSGIPTTKYKVPTPELRGTYL